MWIAARSVFVSSGSVKRRKASGWHVTLSGSFNGVFGWGKNGLRVSTFYGRSIGTVNWNLEN